MRSSTEPSLVESLRQAHWALLDDLRKLEEEARAESANGPGALRIRIEATRAHLAEHFRFEEENGYMAAVREREPRLERVIDQLADEHRQLMQALEGLLDETREASCLGETFHEEVRQWVERVRQHEQRENDLVQDAFDLDISAED